jgi:hypothetical protein
MDEFYVYAWLRKDGTPYYIGKGKGLRAYRNKKARVSILHENLTEKEAWNLEMELIAKYKRKVDGGILINKTLGGNGGDTVSWKQWITDGVVDKYIDKTQLIPEGWKKGRSNCIFNNSDKQKEFSAKSDRKKFAETMKQKWASGEFVRDHSRCGTRGDDNPAKRPEVREKIKEAALRDSENRSKRMKQNKIWELRHVPSDNRKNK